MTGKTPAQPRDTARDPLTHRPLQEGPGRGGEQAGGERGQQKGRDLVLSNGDAGPNPGCQSGPESCSEQESSFRDPRTQAAWVTGPAGFCPHSQKSRETLLSPQGRPAARGGPGRCLKVTARAGSWPSAKEFPSRRGLAQCVFQGHRGGGGRKKKKLGGWDTLAHFKQRPRGHLGGNRLLTGCFPIRGTRRNPHSGKQ